MFYFMRFSEIEISFDAFGRKDEWKFSERKNEMERLSYSNYTKTVRDTNVYVVDRSCRFHSRKYSEHYIMLSSSVSV